MGRCTYHNNRYLYVFIIRQVWFEKIGAALRISYQYNGRDVWLRSRSLWQNE